MPLEAPVITATLLIEWFMAILRLGEQKLANVAGRMPTRTITMLRGRTSEGQSIVFCSSTLADRGHDAKTNCNWRGLNVKFTPEFSGKPGMNAMDTSAIDLTAIAIAWGTR